MRDILILFVSVVVLSCQPVSLDSDDVSVGTGSGASASGVTEVIKIESVGKGTETSPYTVWQVLGGVERSTDVWVAGYIVGYVTKTINKATFSNLDANTSNIIIASTPDETSITNVLTVQLSATKLKKAVSLGYNPEALHRLVMFHVGTIARYCNALGLRDIDQYRWVECATGTDMAFGKPENEENKMPEDEVGQDKVWRSFYGWKSYLGPDVMQWNTQLGGSSESEPCTIDYILTHDGLLSAYKDVYRYMIGYVVSVNPEISIAGTSAETDRDKTMVLDASDADMLEWLNLSCSHYKSKNMLRIEGKVKQDRKTGIYHIVPSGDLLDWLGDSSFLATLPI